MRSRHLALLTAALLSATVIAAMATTMAHHVDFARLAKQAAQTQASR